MLEDKSCKVEVSCKISSSEDPSKVKAAVLNIFPTWKISVNAHQLIGKSSGIGSL